MGIKKGILKEVERGFTAPIERLSTRELYEATGSAIMRKANKAYIRSSERKENEKTAYYMSAEFLMGRAIYSNISNLGLTEEVRELFAEHGIDFAAFEDVEDAALGNGGLGRLAACFLDSAATLGLNLDGYGIRYRYGLFKQCFEDGFQKEKPDDWLKWGDPFSRRIDADAVTVSFGDFAVKAVPYDMPVIGYGGETVNRLRLWQSEPMSEFDFEKFDDCKYVAAYKQRAEAEKISALLYPNDSTPKGKRLRLMQEYFFTSASLQDVLRRLERNGHSHNDLPKYAVFQLNDTHPVLAIPELIRLLKERGESFEDALGIAKKVFAYTNHTIMSEALERWQTSVIKRIVPEVYEVIKEIDAALLRELAALGASKAGRAVIEGGSVHMARLACFVSKAVNGVAKIHSGIIKTDTLKEWYELYPEKFFNETNGVTFRRWLLLANPRLASFITEHIGDKWIRDYTELEKLKPLAGEEKELKKFAEIKHKNKKDLCAYIEKKEGVTLSPDFIFDVQIKRLHEYKRQLLNALSIVTIYNGLKDGRIKDFKPTAFIFGAKAAPAYKRAKGIIKYINEIALRVNADEETNSKLKVVFVTDYNVSYAEKLAAAADVSEQISAAGTEASGTGNMKLMLSGAVTLGTYDGANIEIAEAAGEENEYIFGARVEDLAKIKDSYDPQKLYKSDPVLKKALDTLIDGTFSDGGTGVFRELYDSLLVGASWHKPDNYYLLLDFAPYVAAKLKVNADYGSLDFVRKCFVNTASAGGFSSDRTVKSYSSDIWGLEGV